MPVSRSDITGLVLAGGLGRRMGGVDKGLLDCAGSPLVARVLARLVPQVGAVLVNANRNLERYRAFGYPVVSDATAEHAGPLAGLQAAMAIAATPWILTVPCDSPALPEDLAQKLSAAIAPGGTMAAVASAGGRTQPVFALVSAHLLPELSAYLAGGNRKLGTWYASLAATYVDFPDEATRFRNINTPEDLASFASAQLRA